MLLSSQSLQQAARACLRVQSRVSAHERLNLKRSLPAMASRGSLLSERLVAKRWGKEGRHRGGGVEGESEYRDLGGGGNDDDLLAENAALDGGSRLDQKKVNVEFSVYLCQAHKWFVLAQCIFYGFDFFLRTVTSFQLDEKVCNNDRMNEQRSNAANLRQQH